MKRGYECTMFPTGSDGSHYKRHRHEERPRYEAHRKRAGEELTNPSKRPRYEEQQKRTASMELNNPSKRQRVSNGLLDELQQLRMRVCELTAFQRDAYKVIAGQTARIRQLEHMTYSSPNQMHICNYVAAR